MKILLYESNKIFITRMEKIIKVQIPNANVVIIKNYEDGIKILNYEKIDIIVVNCDIKFSAKFIKNLRNCPNHYLTTLVLYSDFLENELYYYKETGCYKFLYTNWDYKIWEDTFLKINKYKNLQSKTLSNFLELKVGKSYVAFKRNEIIYMETCLKKNLIVTENGITEVNHFILKNSNIILGNNFIRCYKSIVVNSEYIEKINFGKDIIILKNNFGQLPIGKTFKSDLKKLVQ